MLYWFKLFLFFFLLGFFSLATVNYSLLFLLLHSELLIIILFLLFSFLACTYNINFLLGFALSYLIFGGMEIALNLLLLAF